jgi:hypothetical protein
MFQKRRGRARKFPKSPANVFLNIPYDQPFQNLFLAYIAGMSAFGLVPRATLEIRGGTRRLDRIFALIKTCPYSVHDLSRVELDMKRPPTPRFNMPFELGLSVAWAKLGLGPKQHTWFVYEAKKRRITKSLSDLNGTDIYIHDGKVGGVFRELCNAFVRSGRQPSVQQMRRIYRDMRNSLRAILKGAGTKSVFQARTFKDICVVASASANEHVP